MESSFSILPDQKLPNHQNVPSLEKIFVFFPNFRLILLKKFEKKNFSSIGIGTYFKLKLTLARTSLCLIFMRWPKGKILEGSNYNRSWEGKKTGMIPYPHIYTHTLTHVIYMYIRRHTLNTTIMFTRLSARERICKKEGLCVERGAVSGGGASFDADGRKRRSKFLDRQLFAQKIKMTNKDRLKENYNG